MSVDAFDPTEYNYYEIMDLGLTKEQRDRVVGSSLTQLGKRYDYGQIVL
ncbi:hypothetical protein P4561_14890 [Priestia flexa]|nr:hypothetical protein [Priestia flexa]